MISHLLYYIVTLGQIENTICRGEMKRKQGTCARHEVCAFRKVMHTKIKCSIREREYAQREDETYMKVVHFKIE